MNHAPQQLASGIELDAYSGIVKVGGDLPITSLVSALATTEWMWPFPASALSVSAWLTHDMDGWRRGDPVTQIICGIEAQLTNGRAIAIRPAPRRAVGPDLISANLLSPGLLGALQRAHLIVCGRAIIHDHNYLFSSAEDAYAARAWLRGRGVHPLAVRLTKTDSNASLQLRFSEPQHTEPIQQIVGETVARFGGKQVPSAPNPESATRVIHPMLQKALRSIV